MTSKINEWADFWFYDIGANVIPADTKNKKTNFKWSEFKDKAIPNEKYEELKSNNEFEKGIAMIAGTLFRGPNKGKMLFVLIWIKEMV